MSEALEEEIVEMLSFDDYPVGEIGETLEADSSSLGHNSELYHIPAQIHSIIDLVEEAEEVLDREETSNLRIGDVESVGDAVIIVVATNDSETIDCYVFFELEQKSHIMLEVLVGVIVFVPDLTRHNHTEVAIEEFDLELLQVDFIFEAREPGLYCIFERPFQIEMILLPEFEAIGRLVLWLLLIFSFDDWNLLVDLDMRLLSRHFEDMGVIADMIHLLWAMHLKVVLEKQVRLCLGVEILEAEEAEDTIFELGELKVAGAPGRASSRLMIRSPVLNVLATEQAVLIIIVFGVGIELTKASELDFLVAAKILYDQSTEELLLWLHRIEEVLFLGDEVPVLKRPY